MRNSFSEMLRINSTVILAIFVLVGCQPPAGPRVNVAGTRTYEFAVKVNKKPVSASFFILGESILIRFDRTAGVFSDGKDHFYAIDGLCAIITYPSENFIKKGDDIVMLSYDGNRVFGQEVKPHVSFDNDEFQFPIGDGRSAELQLNDKWRMIIKNRLKESQRIVNEVTDETSK
jgi:hypothetical protein